MFGRFFSAAVKMHFDEKKSLIINCEQFRTKGMLDAQEEGEDPDRLRRICDCALKLKEFKADLEKYVPTASSLMENMAKFNGIPSSYVERTLSEMEQQAAALKNGITPSRFFSRTFGLFGGFGGLAAFSWFGGPLGITMAGISILGGTLLGESVDEIAGRNRAKELGAMLYSSVEKARISLQARPTLQELSEEKQSIVVPGTQKQPIVVPEDIQSAAPTTP